MGFLYGKFNEDTTVKAEFIYEPPQETTDTTFTILPDPKEVRLLSLSCLLRLLFFYPANNMGVLCTTHSCLLILCSSFEILSYLMYKQCVLLQQVVEGLASMLGLQKVGWIFSHPAREKG